jgi:predicted DNA-binding protein (MmcQ/YjbR family)
LTLAELDAVCRALPAVTMVVQWGASNVYKVGGKVFAIASEESVSFKASEIAYEAYVSGGRGIRAPYTQAGSSWLNLAPLADKDQAEVADLLANSHAIMAAKLTKKARAELGLA